MKPYPNYKTSGVEWLGDIPEHWGVSKIKYSASIKARVGWQGLNSSEFILEGPYLVTGVDFANGKIKWESCYHVSIERYLEDSNIQLRNGDLLVTKDGTIGKTAIVDSLKGYATLNSGIFVVRPHQQNVSAEFLYWLLNSNVFNQFIDNAKTGSTVLHLYQNVFENFSFGIPLDEEQKRICKFLKEKIAIIDTLIEKKENFIELLEEERQAVINHAVTKGLDPTVKMKPSDIEWLGDVPEHWEVRRISRSFDIIGSGATPEAGNEDYYNNGTIPWLLTGDLTDNFVHSTTKKITEKALRNYSTLKKYPIGSLAIAMYGATIGKLGLLELETTVNQACCVLGNSRFFNIKFAYFWFLVNRPHVISLGYGGGQPNISQELLKSLRLPCPPLEEQLKIVDYLEDFDKGYNKLLKNAEKEMDLLTEYRTSIITEVVTGKISVI